MSSINNFGNRGTNHQRGSSSDGNVKKSEGVKNCFRAYASCYPEAHGRSLLTMIRQQLGPTDNRSRQAPGKHKNKFKVMLEEVLRNCSISSSNFLPQLNRACEKLLFKYRCMPRAYLSVLVFVMLVCLKICTLSLMILNFLNMSMKCHVMSALLLILLVTVLWFAVHSSNVMYHSWKFACFTFGLKPDPDQTKRLPVIYCRINRKDNPSMSNLAFECFRDGFCQRVERASNGYSNFYLKSKSRILNAFYD